MMFDQSIVLYCITKVNKRKYLYYKSKQRCMTKVLYYKSKQRCMTKVLYYKSKQMYYCITK